MKPLKAYSYVVLRYLPDIVTGEALNMGLVFYCPADHFLGVKMRSSIVRISQAFPGTNGQNLKRIAGWISTSIGKHARQLSGKSRNLFRDDPRTALDFAQLHFPNDDSSLRWSAQRHGLAADPSVEMERLFNRLIVQYDRAADRQARSDADVWFEYLRALDAVGLASGLQEHTVQGEIEPYKFDHALKNGKWHCLEPLSFDLMRPDNIKSKARDKFAEMTFLTAPPDDLKVYFLIGEPQTDEGKRAADTAIRILERSPLEKEVVRENEAVALAHRLTAVMH
jgi:hypothetical protein